MAAHKWGRFFNHLGSPWQNFPAKLYLIAWIKEKVSRLFLLGSSDFLLVNFSKHKSHVYYYYYLLFYFLHFFNLCQGVPNNTFPFALFHCFSVILMEVQDGSGLLCFVMETPLGYSGASSHRMLPSQPDRGAGPQCDGTTAGSSLQLLLFIEKFPPKRCVSLLPPAP